MYLGAEGADVRGVRRVEDAVLEEAAGVARGVLEPGHVLPVRLGRVKLHLTVHDAALSHPWSCHQKIELQF